MSKIALLYAIKPSATETRHYSSTYQRSLEILTRLSVQAGKLVKPFDQDTKLNILKMGNIPPVQISPEYMVAMKVDLAIPCSEKLKTICRSLVHTKHLKIMAKF